MSEFNPVIIVPHYNHLAQFERYLPDLLSPGVPLLVVDDGSDRVQVQGLQTLANTHGFHLQCRPQNEGKGAAMVAGFRFASESGFSHALQLDADGQHDTHDIMTFLDASHARPETMI